MGWGTGNRTKVERARGSRSSERQALVWRVTVAVAGLTLATSGTGVAQQPPPCSQMSFERSTFTVCVADLRRQAVRLFWQRPDGQAYGYLGSLPHTLPSGATPAAAGAPVGQPAPKTPSITSARLQFAMNGGMFHADYKPVGLYVENGREITRVNTRNGPGNFHLKPNGIFYTDGATAGVMETGAFLRARPQAEFATQSGPMLVINGRLHPRFSRTGESQKARNGVGVRDANTVVFAISEGEVSFGTFARLFRDGLKCANALFLDGGSAPALYAPALHRGGNFLPLGPMIGVFDKGR